MKHHIEVLGFDGKDFWRLFFFEISKNKDIYLGLVSKNIDLHTSRHKSGKMHWKSTKYKFLYELPSRQSIDNIESIEFLGTFGLNKDEITKGAKKYYSKRIDGTFVIDLRNFKGTINIQPAIVNPNNAQPLISNLLCKQTYIYSKSTPWLVIYVLDSVDLISSKK